MAGCRDGRSCRSTTSSGCSTRTRRSSGFPTTGPPAVRRASVEVGPGRHLSALVWGDGPPELVLLHGGRPERPHVGHGRDGARPSAGGHRPPRPRALRRAGGGKPRRADERRRRRRRRARRWPPRRGRGRHVARRSDDDRAGRRPPATWSAGRCWSTSPRGSRARARRPSSPSSTGRRASPTSTSCSPARWSSTPPARSRRCAGASCTTRSSATTAAGCGATAASPRGSESPERSLPAEDLWDALERIAVPLMLVRGMRAGSVVDDEAEAELRRRQPTRPHRARRRGRPQRPGRRPLDLARLLHDFIPPP